MPRNSSGVAIRLANTTAIPGAIIQSTTFNALIDDMHEMLNDTSDTTTVYSSSDFNSALSGTKAIKIPASVSKITIDSDNEDLFLEKLPQIEAAMPVDIILPSGTKTITTGNIFEITNRNANITICGANPIETTLVSVQSVSGASYNWDVVHRVEDATGIEVGDVAWLWNVGPFLSLSGDNAFNLRDRPLAAEIYFPHRRVGSISKTSGTNTATLSTTTGTPNPITTHLAVNDLVHVGGETNQITAINNTTRVLTFANNWTYSSASETNYAVTIPDLGTASLAASTSDTLNFSNGITTARAEVGGMVAVAGMFIKITAVNDSNTVTLSHDVTFSSNQPYTIITPGQMHEGAHLVTAVSGNDVTVKYRGRIAPPAKRVATGEFVAIKTVMHNTGTGHGILPISDQASIKAIKNIALRGDRNTTASIGIFGNGATSSAATIDGFSSSINVDGFVGVLDFGRNVYNSAGCSMNLLNLAATGALEKNIWFDSDAKGSLRKIVAVGAQNENVLFGPGVSVRYTEGRAMNGGGDGFRGVGGARPYAEISVSIANAEMGNRWNNSFPQNPAGCVSALNDLSGVYSKGADSGAAIVNMFIAANQRSGIEALDFSKVDAESSIVTGTNGKPLEARRMSKIGARFTNLGGNKDPAFVDRDSTIYIEDASPPPAVQGVTAINTVSSDGSLITDFS